MTTNVTWDSVNKPYSPIESARKWQKGQRKSRTLGKPVSFYNTRNICTIVFWCVSSTRPANLICICFLDEKKRNIEQLSTAPFCRNIPDLFFKDWLRWSQTNIDTSGIFRDPIWFLDFLLTRSETNFGSFTNPAIPSYWKHALISKKICGAKGQVSHDTLGTESTRPAWPVGSCGWGGSCKHFHPFSSCRAEWCICKMP